MERSWPIIVELCAGADIDNRLLTGVHWLESRLVDPQGEERSLTEPETRRKLLAAGNSAVLRSIGDAAAYYNRGGQVVFARGILKIINHKRRIRLCLRGDREVLPA